MRARARLYQDYNKSFAQYGKDKTGQRGRDPAIARRFRRTIAVGDRRITADVVTLSLAYDIDAIAQKAKLLPANW